MKRTLLTVVRAILLLAYVICASRFLQYEKGLASQTFNFMPEGLLLPTVSVVLGAVLRCDVFFGGFRFRVDWLSLLVLGLPSLLLAYFMPLGFLFLRNVPLPNFVTWLWEDTAPVFAGTLFGYTVINGLFVHKASTLPEGNS